MTPREAGIQAFYADEGTTNTLQGLNAAFDAYEAASWQPIETAPKDGTLILVPTSSTGLVNVVSWNDGGWRETASYLLLRNAPKFWHLIPALPARSKAKEA
nr:hypothetical protein RAR13_11670 [Aminobacter aminovorans]